MATGFARSGCLLAEGSLLHARAGDGGVDTSRQMLLQKNIDDRAIIDYSINIPIRVYGCEVGHTIHNVFG